MNKNYFENKTLTKALLVLLTFAFIGLGLYFNKSVSLRKEMVQINIDKELLLSEKLNLEKMIHKLNEELTSQKGRSTSLDKVIGELADQLKSKEGEIKSLMKDRVTVRSLRQKLAEVEELRNKLQAEVATYNKSIEQLRKENEDLTREFMSMRSDYEQIKTNYYIVSNLLAANYMVEALKGKKDKPTLNARKTDKLVVSLELPNDVANTLKFKIITPEGKELSNADPGMQIVQSSFDELFEADMQVGVSCTNNNEKIELIYKPEEKLTKGIYTFQIFSNESYVASIQQRLK